MTEPEPSKRPKKPWNYGKSEADWRGEDGSAWFEWVDPAKGLPLWLSLYHHINPDLARQVYALVLDGSDNKSIIDGDWSNAEIESFRIKGAHLRRMLIRLKEDLLGKLRRGELIGFGYANTASLDAPRQRIAPDRWQDLEIDLKKSAARSPGLAITQILVFAGDVARGKSETTSHRKHSAVALRTWYIARVKEFVGKGLRSSRERDHEDANQMFGGQISRRIVEELRREHAPELWRRQGRPRGRKASDAPE